MKYTNEVMINKPREKVIEAFDSFDNMFKWQPTLKHAEHLTGEPGQTGATMRMVYDEGGREIEMVETIVNRDLPAAFHATYEAKGVYNMQENYFHAEGDQTRWVSVSEFKFSGMMVLMGIFMRGAFPKQTLATMEAFKEFAEGQA